MVSCKYPPRTRTRARTNKCYFFPSQVQKGEEELVDLQERMSRICSVADELSLQRLAFNLEEAAAARDAHRIRHSPTLLPTLSPCQRHEKCACLSFFFICVCVAFMRLKKRNRRILAPWLIRWPNRQERSPPVESNGRRPALCKAQELRRHCRQHAARPSPGGARTKET